MNESQKLIIDKFRRRDPKFKIRWNYESKAPAVISGMLAEPFYGISRKVAEEAAMEFLEENKSLFHMVNPKEELSVISKVTDSADNISVAMQQEYKGIPVYGGTLRVQFSNDKILRRVDSKYIADIEVDIKPKVKSGVAVEKVLKKFDSAMLEKESTPNLSILKHKDHWQLCWVIRIRAVKDKHPHLLKCFVSAETGEPLIAFEELKKFPMITGQGTGYYYPVPGNINVFDDAGTYKMEDHTREATGGPVIYIHDLDGNGNDASGNQPDLNNNNISTDLDNNWNSAATPSRKDHQGPEVDALKYAGVIVNYFSTTHVWNSLDNAGIAVHVGAHYGVVGGTHYDPADNVIRLDDGDGNLLDYVSSKDAIAHEFTHGVIDHSSNFDYAYWDWSDMQWHYPESGAMSEGFADIFALMIDRDDIEIGEEVYTPSTAGDALRKPGEPWSLQQYVQLVDHYLASLDSSGRGFSDLIDNHETCGIIDYMAHLLIHGGTHPNSNISVNGIGYEKAEKILFHALTIGMSGNNNATFLECREAALNAVDFLYKNDPDYLSILDSVKNTFTAVGIGPDVYIRDSLTDTGVIPSIGTLWLSPDIITRTEPVANPQADLGDMNNANLSENVESGQDNYVYLRLQNRGSVAGDVTATVYWSEPTTFANPGNWHLIGNINVTGAQPGQVKIVGPILWPTAQVPGPGHFCLVSELDDSLDPAPDKSLITTGEMYTNFISQSNNFAWKNINVVDAIPAGIIDSEFLVQAPEEEEKGDLLIDVTNLPKKTEITIRILRRLCENIEINGLHFLRANTRYNYYSMNIGKINSLGKIPFKSNDMSEVHVYLKFPEKSKGIYDISFSQYFGGKIVGRLTNVINLMPTTAFAFIGNRNTKEVHKRVCEWVAKMSKSNMVGFHSLEYAHMRGYDNCYFCLGESKR